MLLIHPVHGVDVEAESLYEAVAVAVAEFREDPLLRSTPGPMTEFTVAVYRNPTEHRIRLQPVTKWAKNTTSEGPAGLRNANVSVCFVEKA